MHVGSGTDVDHSGLVFGCGGLEEGRKEQLREVEGTWLQTVLKWAPSYYGGIFLTERVGAPGHVVPVNGNLFNRTPHDATVSEGGFNLALTEKERNARIVE